MKPIRIMCFFAAYGRPQILEVCLLGLERLMKYKPAQFQFDAFCVYSGEELKPILDKFKINCIEYKNLPVGEKKNAGLNEILKPEYEWDYLLELGDDDLIANKLLDVYLPLMQAGELFFGISACHFYEPATKKAACWKGNHVIGLARCFHRSVFDHLQASVKVRFLQSIAGLDYSFQINQEVELKEARAEGYLKAKLVEIIDKPSGVELWEPHKNRALDYSSQQTLAAYGISPVSVDPGEGVFGLDIKTDVNIHLMEEFKDFIVDDLDVLKKFSKKEQDAIGKA